MLTLEPRVTEGTLKTKDGRVLPLEWTKVEAKIAGPLANVEVRQKFKNDTDVRLEATYLFPLPHQASVFRMEFRIGDRVVKGKVKEKEEARRTYEAAKAQGRAATLLEQDRPNLFTLSVANIAPGSDIEVILEYQELVTYDQGEWRFVFPMVAGERYHAGSKFAGMSRDSTTEVPDGAKIRPPRARRKERVSPISLNLTVTGLNNLVKPYSPSHAVALSPHGQGFQVKLADENEIPNKDFVLVWKTSGRGVLPMVWFDRQLDKPGTFCVSIPAPRIDDEPDEYAEYKRKRIGCGNCGAPKEENNPIQDLEGFGPAWQCEYCGAYQKVDPGEVERKDSGKDITFVIDQSASMRNLESAAKVVMSALERLEETDAFRIIGFNHQLRPLSEEWMECNDSNRKRAKSFLDQIESRGGTELEAALRAAADQKRENRTRIVVLFTDAAVGNEGNLLKKLPKALNGARLYVLGLGPATNRYLIDKMALHGKGSYDVAVSDEPEVLDRFARQVAEAGPVLTDLKLEWADSAGMNMYPSENLELFSGQSLRVTGRFISSGPASLIITGKTRHGQDFRQELTAVMPDHDDQTPGLERVWARHRIDDLQDQLTRHPERLSEVRLEVLGLALKHQLMSPYTSLVAEDSEQTVDALTPLKTVQVETAALEPEKKRESKALFGSSAPASRRGLGMKGASESIGFRSRSAPPPAGSPPLAPALSEMAPPLESEFFDEGPGGEDLFGEPEPASLFDEVPAAEGRVLGGPPAAAPAPSGGGGWLGDEPMPAAESDEGGWLGSSAGDSDLIGGTGVTEDLFILDPEEEEVMHDLSWSDESVFPDDDFSDHDVTDYVPVPPKKGLFSRLKDGLTRKDTSPSTGTSKPTLGRRSEPAAPPLTLESRRPASHEAPRQVQGQQQVEYEQKSDRISYSEEELARARELVQGRLDLVFLIDETGSMGAYIQEVQDHLYTLIRAVRQSPLCRVLRLGLVTYRDHPPQDNSFVTRVAPLTENIDHIRDDINRMRASGGGDGPEAVTEGIHELLSLNWDPEAARLVVMVGDAPPHGVEPSDDGFPDGPPTGRHWFTQAESCREMGITVHTVGCQGIGMYAGAVEVFKSVASTTGGLYLPLNHSHLLIEMVTGLADREFDRQRLAKYVAEVFNSHQSALLQADNDEQVRFITQTLQARKLEVLDVDPTAPGKAVQFRLVNSDDVKVALQSLQLAVV